MQPCQPTLLRAPDPLAGTDLPQLGRHQQYTRMAGRPGSPPCQRRKLGSKLPSQGTGRSATPVSNQEGRSWTEWGQANLLACRSITHLQPLPLQCKLQVQFAEVCGCK